MDPLEVGSWFFMGGIVCGGILLLWTVLMKTVDYTAKVLEGETVDPVVCARVCTRCGGRR